MTDSIAVLPPGWRATDSSGNIITDGILAFFDAGTSDTRTVYSNSGLSTSLGVTVNCNSGGEPVTSGNARTLIYTGTTAYKVRLTSVLGGGTIWEFDNVKGALDTSTFLTSAAVADQSVVNISANRSITAADKGKLINANCSGGTLTMTFADAATLGDGFFCGIRHAGTANQVKITGDGVDTFAIPGASPTGFSLTGLGHTVWIACDAANFKIHSECPPLLGGTVGLIVIADRLSTPPGSPNPGARYIVGSAPTGAWSGFAEYDIAEASGFGTWFNYTPATDCGWIAYVQDEDVHYAFRGTAWGILLTAASDTVAGAIEYAVQSEMEAASSTTLAVTPGRQRYHPGMAKFWAFVTVSAGVPTLAASYNVTSITDAGTGLLTVTIATDFSSANWCCQAMAERNAVTFVRIETGTIAAGSVQIQVNNSGATATDPDSYHVTGYGDQ